MTVTAVSQDPDDLSVTITARFGAPPERVWELWADPRQLERWWGPPGYPATFETLDLRPGGEASYFMMGPGGERHTGLWRVTAVEAPASLDFTDVFMDREGNPADGMPEVRVSVRLAGDAGGTRMEMRSEFDSREDLEAWLDTGTREGQQAAIAQMDALLGSRPD